MKPNDGGPAYPFKEWVDIHGESDGVDVVKEKIHPGMSKLEVFAMAVSVDVSDYPYKGLERNARWAGWSGTTQGGEIFGCGVVIARAKIEAKIRFIYADAMLAESAKRAAEGGRDDESGD